jgi:hypothetical protein
MSISTWTTTATRLVAITSLVLAACDDGKDSEGPAVAQPGETEGATESEGEDPGATAGETDPGESAEGPIPGETEGEPEPELCSEPGASRVCATGGGDGTQFCDGGVWGPCLAAVVCTPGESRCCGGFEGDEGTSSGGDDWGCQVDEQCRLYGGVPDWNTNHESEDGCNTPLVLSFDGRPAELLPARAATFDLDGVGGCITTDWPAASTPWLALDRDGNGTIDSGRELFGSGTRLRSGERAPHGFAALAELDDDGNGRIDAADAAFAQLLLWGDDDGDRRSTFAEAQPVSHYRVLSIDLGYRIDRQCDARGNCGVERATFHYIDAHGAVRQGEVVDLHLACQ